MKEEILIWSRLLCCRKLPRAPSGKVVLARKKRTDSLHAIKAVRKDKILACGSTAIRHILDENKILQQLKHPFILTLQHAFQDEFRLYLVTNYVGVVPCIS